MKRTEIRDTIRKALLSMQTSGKWLSIANFTPAHRNAILVIAKRMGMIVTTRDDNGTLMIRLISKPQPQVNGENKYASSKVFPRGT